LATIDPGPSRSVWATRCGHAPDREDDEDCGCRDCDVDLVFTVSSIVRGGQSRTVTLSGQCTLAPDEEGGAPKFGAKDWSWEQELVEAVEALIGDDFSALDDVESAIEAAVTR
jgi:ligand-binding sensor protein